MIGMVLSAIYQESESQRGAGVRTGGPCQARGAGNVSGERVGVRSSLQAAAAASHARSVPLAVVPVRCALDHGSKSLHARSTGETIPDNRRFRFTAFIHFVPCSLARCGPARSPQSHSPDCTPGLHTRTAHPDCTPDCTREPGAAGREQFLVLAQQRGPTCVARHCRNRRKRNPHDACRSPESGHGLVTHSVHRARYTESKR